MEATPPRPANFAAIVARLILAAEGKLTMTQGAHGAQIYGLPKEQDRLEVELV